jgi:hypothetical protein
MKLYKIAAAAALAAGCFAGGIYASNLKTASQLALEECAREHNVFACKWEAVPETPPTVVYKQPELLPPPAI